MSDDRGKPVLNLRKAAQGTLALLFEHTEGTWPAGGPCGKAHVMDMLHGIEDGTIAGEKAHRWLGWAQCAIVASGCGTLDDMKTISVAALGAGGVENASASQTVQMGESGAVGAAVASMKEAAAVDALMEAIPEAWRWR